MVAPWVKQMFGYAKQLRHLLSQERKRVLGHRLMPVPSLGDRWIYILVYIYRLYIKKKKKK